MKKILLISDSPYATTGLGRMSKYFLKMLPEFEWVVWGFLHNEFLVRRSNLRRPVWNPKDFPGKVELLSPEAFGEDQYGLDLIPDLIKKIKPDYVLTSMDLDKTVPLIAPINQIRFEQPNLKWINYFPMDREDYKRLEVGIFRYPDINVCITKFGVDKIHSINPKIDIKQIYHPIDASEFPEVSRKEIHKFRDKTWQKQVDKKTFLVGTVNRSFARKNTALLIKSFVKFLQQTENTYAYLHGAQKTFERIDLAKLAEEDEVPQKRLAFLPPTVNEVDAVSPETLNNIYKSLDLFVTLSAGEGYGFTTVEAMLSGIPIIAPKNTCFPELVQDFGYLVDCPMMAFHHNGSTAMWPIVDIDEVVEKLHYVRENYSEAKEKVSKARPWIEKNLSLDTIANQWREILK